MRRRDFLPILGTAVGVRCLPDPEQQPHRPPFVQFMESLYVEGLDLTREPDSGRGDEA
jgi:hypothetical protein